MRSAPFAAATGLALAFLAAAAEAPGHPVETVQGLILGVRIAADNPNPVRPTAPISDLNGVAQALAGCWSPPDHAEVANPPDVIFQVSYRRNGTLFGRPRTIEFSRAVTAAERGIFYQAVARALDLCSSLPFTDGLGGAVAGRTFRVVLQDRRNQRQALR
jgi:hypothetical protein